MKASSAFLIVVAMAGCGEVPDGEEVEVAHSALTNIFQSGGLVRDLKSYSQIIDAWGLPTVSIANLNLNRSAPSITASHAAIVGTQAAAKFRRGFRWNDDDSFDDDWTPQGLASDPNGNPQGGRSLLVASWYRVEPNPRSSRVSFVDVTDISNVKYRHVMLVEPNGSSFRDVPVHAGGIAWYNNLLYVADTDGGLRVFDLTRIKEVPSCWGMGRIALTNVFCAWDHRYVLPQIARYTGSGGFSQRWSFLGLDRSRSPHLLISGEYNPGDRVFWWPLDPATGWLTVEPISHLVKANFAATSPTKNLQGVYSFRSASAMSVVLTSTAGDPPAVPDKLVRYTLGNTLGFVFPWAAFPQGLTSLPNGELWTLNEATDQRIAFAVWRTSVLP